MKTDETQNRATRIIIIIAARKRLRGSPEEDISHEYRHKLVLLLPNLLYI